MSAKASGASPNGSKPNGSAQQRHGHNDGSSGRAFTEEQKVAVMRVRKCSPTAFYDILDLEAVKKTIDDAGIKKAYRKQSLLTHPDKNGYEGADEAFKMISRAFQILSDTDKKKSYDQFGVDPDNRFSSAAAQNPFSGFSRSTTAGGRRGMFEEEISPEELFRQFFGGGLGGGFGSPFGGGIFDNGPGFVFNLGGGPGVRVHQFGGPRVRRRPPGTGAAADEPPRTALSALQNLLPLLLIFILPLLSSLFSGSDSSSTPSTRVPFHVDTPAPPLTSQHISSNLRVPYYVNPRDVAEYTPRKWRQLDNTVEVWLMRQLNAQCDAEYRARERLVDQAQGWFFTDQEKMEEARRMPMSACVRLRALNGR